MKKIYQGKIFFKISDDEDRSSQKKNKKPKGLSFNNNQKPQDKTEIKKEEILFQINLNNKINLLNFDTEIENKEYNLKSTNEATKKQSNFNFINKKNITQNLDLNAVNSNQFNSLENNNDLMDVKSGDKIIDEKLKKITDNINDIYNNPQNYGNQNNKINNNQSLYNALNPQQNYNQFHGNQTNKVQQQNGYLNNFNHGNNQNNQYNMYQNLKNNLNYGMNLNNNGCNNMGYGGNYGNSFGNNQNVYINNMQNNNMYNYQMNFNNRNLNQGILTTNDIYVKKDETYQNFKNQHNFNVSNHVDLHNNNKKKNNQEEQFANLFPINK